MANGGQTILVESVQKLLRRDAQKALVKILRRTHAADVAIVFRHLSERDQQRLFEFIPDIEQKGVVLSETCLLYTSPSPRD